MSQSAPYDSYKKGKIIFILGSFICSLLMIIIVILYITLGSLNAKINSEKASTPNTEYVTNSTDRGNWKFEVVNGSGIEGFENDVRDFLTELGYSVLSTKSAELHETSTLMIRPDMADKKEELLEDLGEFFKITTVSTDLPSFNEVNARIILGKD